MLCGDQNRLDSKLGSVLPPCNSFTTAWILKAPAFSRWNIIGCLGMPVFGDVRRCNLEVSAFDIRRVSGYGNVLSALSL